MKSVMKSVMNPKRAALALVVAMVATLLACRSSTASESGESGRKSQPAGFRSTVISTKAYGKPTDEVLRRTLTPIQYEITQKAGTEPPFHNTYWDNHAAGLYVDVATGEPLFSSTDKFESGTGWPSFTRPVEPGRLTDHGDDSHGMSRLEVVSHGGRSHLGHVFDDGPAPTNLRYCINSAALRFVPVDRLEAEGYGAYRVLFPGTKPPAAAVAVAAPSSPVPAPAAASETAVLAGGCFWGMEEILRKIPGVIQTEVGYAGGATASPTYEQVSTGKTGHAEAVRIVFDPRRLSYADLLEKWFFRMHDPTTLNRQENDVGTQYRSAIFVTSPEQKKIAEAVRARVDKSGKWKRPLVTQIVAAGPFTRAEDHHQKYLEKNPGGYMCHFLRD